MGYVRTPPLSPEGGNEGLRPGRVGYLYCATTERSDTVYYDAANPGPVHREGVEDRGTGV